MALYTELPVYKATYDLLLDMQTEPSQELQDIELHDFHYSALAVIFPAEADMLVIDSRDAVVADSNFVGIAAQVFDYLAGAHIRET